MTRAQRTVSTAGDASSRRGSVSALCAQMWSCDELYVDLLYEFATAHHLFACHADFWDFGSGDRVDSPFTLNTGTDL